MEALMGIEMVATPKITKTELNKLAGELWPTNITAGSAPMVLEQLLASITAPKRATDLPDRRDQYEDEEAFRIATTIRAFGTLDVPGVVRHRE